ncbi:MAG: 5'/3'-nucleotidase SurE [Alphaproteobacteria bacterium]
MNNIKTNPRILICNDDGFDAKGIKMLEEIARKLSNDVWVVAPNDEKSAASHALTISRPLRVNKISDKHFTVDGSPADCVLIAICKIMKGQKPDLILSGINNGANLSDDVTYSGTIAAAMEGTILGIPSIALSQCYDDNRKTFWKTAETFCENVVRKILTTTWPDNVLMSVNFPSCDVDQVKGIDVIKLSQKFIKSDDFSGFIEDRIDPRGKEYVWVGAARRKEEPEEEGDLKSIMNQKITITPITLDLTDYASLSNLQKVFLEDNA